MGRRTCSKICVSLRLVLALEGVFHCLQKTTLRSGIVGTDVFSNPKCSDCDNK
jgi:hypothetical protein